MSNYTLTDTETIDNGDATDAYFNNTTHALRYANKNPTVTAEITIDQYPTGNAHILAGTNDVATLLEGLPITVESLPEGTAFDGGPVINITGNYLDFAKYETAILGFLGTPTAIATNAHNAVQAANNQATVLSFGARHVNPAIGPMVERAATIGGVDGYSFVPATNHVPGDPSGTMPHALMLTHGNGNQATAFQNYHEAVPDEIPRIALCDTFDDEVNEVITAIETLGDALDGVRLDTTGSRRGDFKHIIREVQTKLNTYGYPDVDIYVSGGLTPTDIRELRDYVTGFGIGGYLSKADPVDFSLDIVEVNGDPVAKRGKLPGKKSTYRRSGDSAEHIVNLSREPAPDNATPLLEPLLDNGNLVQDFSVTHAQETRRTDLLTETITE